MLDPNMTPDGAEVADPFSGRKFTMNLAQRMRLKNAIGQSQQQVNSWQQRAADIEQRFNLPAPGAGNSAPAAGAAQGGAPVAGPRAGSPPASPAKPQSAAPQAKVATKAQVKAYAEKKGVSVDQALKEFQASNYQVQ